MDKDDGDISKSEKGVDNINVPGKGDEKSENLGNFCDVKLKKDKASNTLKRKFKGKLGSMPKKTKNTVSDTDKMIGEVEGTSELPVDSPMVSHTPQKEVPNQKLKTKRIGLKKCVKETSIYNSDSSVVKEKDCFKEQKVKDHLSPQKKESPTVSADNLTSPLKRDIEATESESVDSHQDFSTEGLLEELHFLNASCEKPSFSKSLVPQSCKTPKKQKKSKVKGFEVCRSSTPTDKRSKKLNVVKKCKDEAENNWSNVKVDEAGSPISEIKTQTRLEEDDSEDSDEGSLQIVADDENLVKRKAPYQSKQRRKIQSMDSGLVPQEVIELIQSGIDEVLEEKAERTHLTAIHVKNIIKNVMTDENVLAMVRNTVLGINTTATVSSAVYEPTLTRAKTKEIIQQQAEGSGHRSIWAELSKTTTTASTSLNPETRALVTTDFPEEDEDEEYTPENDEHIHSDDESLVSTNMCSSIGSPTTPCTPTTPLSSCTSLTRFSSTTPCTVSDVDSPAQLLDKRVQELKPKSAQRVLNFEQPLKHEELVSQRTRSKLPLTETPLECLEMAFKPPDVTNDMYETEVLDDDWKTFLIDFIHPLENTEVAEDEEADPEYNILEDKEDASDLREEMRGDRAVQISKKEINDLLTELLGTLDSDEESAEPVRKHLSQHMNSGGGQKRKPSQLKNTESQKDAPVKQEVGPPSDVIWVEVLTAKFTPYQLDVLRQQMSQHVQLLTTTVLLSDELPENTIADSAKLLLEEMKTNSSISEHKNTFFHPFNLDAALSMLQLFDKNKSLGNTPKSETKKNTIELTPRVVEAVLNSTAFPYPNLLPKRMFSDSTKNKTIFVPGEDMLVVMAMLNYLVPKSEPGKVIKLPPHLYKVVKDCLKDRVLHKTAKQVQSRIKNVRQNLKEHLANQNPLAVFIDSGKVDPPVAMLEPLLPSIPCLVKDIPEKLLPEPWQKILISRRQIESRKLRLNTENLRTQGRKMVKIQPKSCAKVMVPSTYTPIGLHPSISFAYSGPRIAVLPPVTTIKTLPVQGSLAVPLSLTKPVTSNPSYVVSLTMPSVSQPGEVTAEPLTSGDSRKLSTVGSKSKSILVKPDAPVTLQNPEIQGDAAISGDSVSDKNLCTISQEENSGTNTSDLKTTAVKSCSELKSDISSAVEHLSGDSDESDTVLSKKMSLGESLEYPLETPHKSPSLSLQDIPTPNLHMPSLLSTPEKSNPSPVNDSRFCMPAEYTLCWERKCNQSETNNVPESLGLACSHPENFAGKNEKESGPMRNVTNSEYSSNALSREDKEASTEKTGKPESSLDSQGPLHGTSATMVTSVYQSPIPSSGIGGIENIRLIMNVSPQKTYSPYRKISPAKILRSPIKTSPMKKVSPILRKYGYRSKIRPSSKKLSPILPKLTPQKPQRIKSPAQRRLTPKVPKEDSPKPESQNYSASKSNNIDQLPQVEEELPLVNEAPSDSSHLKSTVPHLEEEFEEDDLEEEEDEEEEEDSEAAQQREEHLAALLKASSTIAGKKGDKLSGGDIGPAERRLNKQQRRLQARITALSIVQDSFSKDLSMAQSYLMRVREALTGRDPALYKKFLCILNEFTENASDSPVELYGHLCEVLKDFPQLKDEFVSFLLPQQAIAIGKYAQYCAIHRMKDFLDKLKLQFRKQPQHIQKIVRALQSLQNNPEINVEKVQASICPLLRYPHLVESFTQCFASQPPPPSLSSDFEDISLEKSHTPDSVENLVLPNDDTATSPDHCGCPCHVPATGSSLSTTRSDHCQSCAIRFSEGRVYLQYGKTLRPAKVTYHSLDGNSRDSVDFNDGCEISGKGKGTGSKKASQLKDSSESGLMRNKENMNTINVDSNALSNVEHKGSPYLGEKVTKDELPNQFGKQKESATGRVTVPKKSLSSRYEEKGDSVDDDVITDSQQTPSTSSFSVKARGTVNVDPDVNSKTRRKSGVGNSLSKDTHGNDSFQSSNIKNKSSSVFSSGLHLPVQSSLGDVSRSDSSQDSSALGKKPKETTVLTSSGYRKDVPNIIQKVLESKNTDDLAASDTDNVPNRNKKSTEDGMERCTLNTLSEKYNAPNILQVSDASVWTQEEDRLMLMVLQKKGSIEPAVQEIMRIIPNRTHDEVVEHFNVLLGQMMEESDMEDIVLSSEDDSTKD
ncbi:GON-4-like protein [Macrobrachium rosenbergii]|uniref:GON-4-like protein n=1 Tax=Macrobrachium rosenbergii TaxID=79674 RepID=UPI0034D4459F